MDNIEREIVALRIQEWLLNEHDLLATVQAIEDAMDTVFDERIEADIRQYRNAQDEFYTLTEAGRKHLAGEK